MSEARLSPRRPAGAEPAGPGGRGGAAARRRFVLERYVASELLPTVAFAFFVFTLIFLIGMVNQLFRADISPRQILWLLPWTVPQTLPYTLPIALLVGASLAYGRLAGDNEVLALRAAGVHLGRIVAPALLLGLAGTGVVYYLLTSFIPYCQFKRTQLVREFVEELLTLGHGENKRIQAKGQLDFFCRRYDAVPGGGAARLEGVYLVVKKGKAPVEVAAERGRVQLAPDGASILFDLEGVDVTVSELSTPRPGEPDPGGLPDAPPRRTSIQSSRIDRTVIAVPIEFRRRSRHTFQPSEDLGRLRDETRARLDWLEGPGPAIERAAALAAVAAGASPGAGPGHVVVAGAGLGGAAGGGPLSKHHLEDKEKDVTVELQLRRVLALGPVLLALMGAVVPLLLEHPNRLVSFFVAFLTAAGCFFAPLLVGRRLAVFEVVPPSAIWAAAVISTIAIALLLRRLFRR